MEVADVPTCACKVGGVESTGSGKVCVIDGGATERCGGEVGLGKVDRCIIRLFKHYKHRTKRKKKKRKKGGR